MNWVWFVNYHSTAFKTIVLNTERSEVLESHEMGIERHAVAIEYSSLPTVVSKIQALLRSVQEGRQGVLSSELSY